MLVTWLKGAAHTTVWGLSGEFKFKCCFKGFATLHEHISGWNAECLLTAPNTVGQHHQNYEREFCWVDPNKSQVSTKPATHLPQWLKVTVYIFLSRYAGLKKCKNVVIFICQLLLLNYVNIHFELNDTVVNKCSSIHRYSSKPSNYTCFCCSASVLHIAWLVGFEVHLRPYLIADTSKSNKPWIFTLFADSPILKDQL